MDIIERTLFNTAIKYEYGLLYDFSTALKLVEICRNLNIEIYRIEMLKLYGYITPNREAFGGIQPNMELTWDETHPRITNSDIWDEVKEQIIRLKEVCRVGYLFDIFYVREQAKAARFNQKAGIDFLFDELSKLSILDYNDERILMRDALLFKFEDLEKVIRRCQECNLPIYRITFNDPDRKRPYDPQYKLYEFELKYEIYFGSNWYEINTWGAAIKHLNSIEDEVKGRGFTAEVFYHGYRNL